MVVPTVRRGRQRHDWNYLKGIVLKSPRIVLVLSTVVATFLTAYRFSIVRSSSTTEQQHDPPRTSWVPPPIRSYNNNNNNNLHDRHDQGGDIQDNPGVHRFLIFRPPSEEAQGLGNVMNGLHATHILGKEFNRTVCVSDEWSDFSLALQSLTPLCHSTQQQLLPPRTPQNTIWLLNYKPLNECELKRRLEGNEAVIYFVSNDYPRWPLLADAPPVPLNDYYHPTHNLDVMLPWTTPPTTVVHLREPDNDQDYREGLDMSTRIALGTELSKDTYLVTNRVEYYSWFQEHYGWHHPPWTGVRHSAIPNLQWTAGTFTLDHTDEVLQLWADWWTLYNAKRVLHTHSDFSRSAIRWSHCENSYTIGGTDEDSGALRLIRDTLWGDALVAPLSEKYCHASKLQ